MKDYSVSEKEMTRLYIKSKTGRYFPVPSPLVLAMVKFNGESLMSGFGVSLSGHLKDVDAEKIIFAVTKGVTDILDCFKWFEQELIKREARISELEVIVKSAGTGAKQ